MEQARIYEDIAKRTGGDIYIGVVGPVLTGKSTLIKRFMEEIVLPKIDNDFQRERAQDELPQSAAGKTVMTTEPKFIPEEAVNIPIGEAGNMRVRLIDCVGYMVSGALGYEENAAPRMVHTPWFESDIPFDEAAEYGTKKVITEHSTIGLVVTTDGSISSIDRADYEAPEARVVAQLKALGKPFVMLLNSTHPTAPETVALAEELSKNYACQVLPVSCSALNERDFAEILEQLLGAFPVKEIAFETPSWLLSLEREHPTRKMLCDALTDWASNLNCMQEIGQTLSALSCEALTVSRLQEVDYGKGAATVRLEVPEALFFGILGERTGIQMNSQADLMRVMVELSETKQKYEKISAALEEVEATGYGIVMPGIEELHLEEPEIVHQNGKYGVRLRASAPSIHMLRANITTEVSPIVGSEQQSEELVRYLMQEFDEDPLKIWESNIFGVSLHELVSNGLHNKLYRMPSDARMRLQETIERIINEGCGGLICVIL